ncbi:hypothetical protein HanOQP8_Chr03g0086951 [Helianthus annuus]|nr:hypothetical protein HanLR1_Chr03g0078361 [Helianthus annuus]KAJ0772405.1 hypothetical protein HanOQP8_Chr03g0086951 [Helianthus annuus]
MKLLMKRSSRPKVHKGWISDVYKRLWLILSFLLFKCSRNLFGIYVCFECLVV